MLGLGMDITKTTNYTVVIKHPKDACAITITFYSEEMYLAWNSYLERFVEMINREDSK